MRGEYGECDRFRRISVFLRDRLKRWRIRQLSTLVCFDEMARRTMLLSEASAVVGVCSLAAWAEKPHNIATEADFMSSLLG